MFYSDNEIHRLKICPKCSLESDDPRILPCGETVCNSCLNTNMKSFECQFCSSEHCTNENGFPKNKLIDQLLRNKPQKL